MSALLTSTAIGILAAWPTAGLGWALGKAADAITEEMGAPAWLAQRAQLRRSASWRWPRQLLTAVAPPVVAAIAAAPTVQEVKAASLGLAVQSPWLPDLFSLGAVALIAASAAGLAVAAARQVLGRRRLARIVRDARRRPPPWCRPTRSPPCDWASARRRSWSATWSTSRCWPDFQGP